MCLKTAERLAAVCRRGFASAHTPARPLGAAPTTEACRDGATARCATRHAACCFTPAQVHTAAEADRWRNAEASDVGRKLRLAKAVDCGEIGALLHVRLFSGMARQTSGESIKLFREEWLSVPYQLCCAAPPNVDERFLECGPKPLEEAFAIGARLLYIKAPYYGLPCRVAAHRSADAKLKVELEVAPKWSPYDELFGKSVVGSAAEFERYYSAPQLARELDISTCAAARSASGPQCQRPAVPAALGRLFSPFAAARLAAGRRYAAQRPSVWCDVAHGWAGGGPCLNFDARPAPPRR